MKILRFTTAESLPEQHNVASGLLANIDVACLGLAMRAEIGYAARFESGFSQGDRDALSMLFNFLEDERIEGVFVIAL